MAQLPPKIPNNNNAVHDHSHNHRQQQQQQQHGHWPAFSHDHHHHQGNQNPIWVDEFMEFSAAKRGAHRRTMSESSVAFMEPVFRETDKGGGVGAGGVDGVQFEKFDDEQFLSMFSNELGASCSNPTSETNSDHNSTNDDQKKAMAKGGGSVERMENVEGGKVKRNEGDEVQSTCNGDKEGQGHGTDKGDGSNLGGNVGSGEDQQAVDPKRVKRILANRQSAQRSRVRKLQYISELERSVTALQSEVSVLSPRVAFLDHQRMILNVDNSSLKAKIAALAQDKIFKDAHQEALRREIERLRQVYYQQNMKKAEGTITPPSSSPLPPPSSSSPLPSPAIHPSHMDIKDNENEHLMG